MKSGRVAKVPALNGDTGVRDFVIERVLNGDRALSCPLLNGEPGTVGILSDPGLPSVYERKSPSSKSLLFV